MWKKISLGLFLVISLGGIVTFYYYLKSQRKNKINFTETIPKNCNSIIETKKIEKFLKKINYENLGWEELKKASCFEDINTQLIKFDSLITEKEELKELFQGQKMSCAIFGKEGDEIIFGITTENILSNSESASLLKRNFKIVKEHKNQEKEISYYEIIISDKLSYSIGYKNGIILFSKSKNKLEEVLLCKKEESLARDADFNYLYERLGDNNEINIILRNNYIDHWIKSIAEKSTHKNPTINVDFKNGWTSFDVSLNTSTICFSGFLKDTESGFVKSLQQQEPVPIQFIDNIPASTKNMAFLGISSYSNYFINLTKSNVNTLENDLAVYHAKLDADFSTEIEQFFAGEIALIRTKEEGNEAYFGLISYKEKMAAEKFLEKLSISRTDNIYDLADSNLFSLISGKVLTFTCRHVKIIEDYLLFSADRSSLHFYEEAILKNGIFSRSADFERIKKSNFAEEGNFYLHTEFSGSYSFIKNYLNTDAQKKWDEFKDISNNFNSAGFQICSNKSGIFTLGYLIHSANNNQYSSSIWETQLDTLCTQAPQLVINHKTGEKEILIQDESNTIYQINKLGKINWKKQLNEKIIGKIHQIDFYKNEKLQYLFNSENYLHLIDRNGNYLKGFPIKLADKATNAISVFDYENEKEYRVILSLENKKVYNYDLQDSSLVEGFVFPTLAQITKIPIQHVRIKEKDYLVAIDQSGKIYLTNRKGELKTIFSTQLKNGLTQPAIFIGNTLDRTYFQTYNQLNKVIQKITLNDKSEEKSIETENTGSFINFDLINEDILYDLITADENGFEVLDEIGNSILKVEFKEEMQAFVEIIKKQEKNYFAQLNKNGELFICNESGSIQKNTKFICGTPPKLIELNNDNQFYLLSAVKNKLHCYLFQAD